MVLVGAETSILAHHRRRLAAREPGLDEPLAKRVYETPALWLLRADDQFLARVHDADLRAKFSFETLDVRELRAVYGRVRDVAFENDASQKKEAWRQGLVGRLKQYADALDRGALDARKARHPAYPKPPDDAAAAADEPPGPFDADAPLVAVVTTYVDGGDADAAPAGDGRSLAEAAEAATMGLEDDGDRFGAGADAGDPDGPDDGAPTPVAAAGRRASLVSLAKAQLRRTSSFADAPTPRSFVVPKKEATDRVKARLAARPKLGGMGGMDLMADLKKTLRRRSLTPPCGGDDDDDDDDEDADAPPPPPPALSAKPKKLPPPGEDILAAIRRRASERLARADSPASA